jgi:ClpP class serine protease
LGEWAAFGAVAREQKSCRKSGARRLHDRLPLRGGGSMDTIKADQIVELGLKTANESLRKELNAEVFVLKGPMRPPVDEIVRDEIESIRDAVISENGGPTTDKLSVILETTGGFIETVERIALSFRNNFSTVEFIVPNYAYSAGTILVMSGDEIHMDYFSVLGPIDPQYPGDDDGDYFTGMGYLARFNQLLDSVNKDVSGDNTRGELAILLKKFHPAKIFDIEQAVEHSKGLLQDWLPRYKFKN